MKFFFVTILKTREIKVLTFYIYNEFVILEG